ncbi:exodeoxyribonuclease VII small subunit [Mucilaginibacter sp. CSA2-8R]|uniref:exodeoxyribonuclease VII small subunit n=1 Tax=Mucilaginibacter sp. CSA2-8R TaxID=3141542 RepID=UPI00315C5D19
MTEDKLTYEAAAAELAEITKEMEEDTITVDALSAKVRRGAYLVNWCKARLKSTEDDIKSILGDLENPVE